MDEEQTDGYSEPCAQCSEVAWAVSDEGRFYCKSCHNVIERTRDVVDTSFIPGSNRISYISKGKRGKKSEQGRLWMICEGFQFILRNQADALLRLGVRSSFKDEVLCQLWRLYLQRSRQAYSSQPIRSLRLKVRAPGSDSDSASESVMSASIASASETDGEGDLHSTAASNTGESSDGVSVCSGSADVVSYLTPSRKRGGGLMTMRKTLALLFLALLWSREALTLSDLLRLVNEGHVPYVNAHESLPEEMRLHGRDTLMFKVESVPSHRLLQQEAQSLAHLLQLPPFPPISPLCLLHPAPLSLRYLTALNLPDALHAWVCRVALQAGLMDEALLTFDPRPSRPALPAYDLQAAALIIVTMKLLFGLDDHTEWDLSSDAAEQDREQPESDVFSLRRWYRLLGAALSRARQRRREETARKQWKAQKPLYLSGTKKQLILKRRRVAEQLQICFEKLSGSSARQRPAPRSFCFLWGEGEGEGEGEGAESERSDGPSLHGQTLQGDRIPPNLEYWHPALKTCTKTCKSHYEEFEPTLPRTFVWLLELFSFLLEVKPASVYEEVLKVERRLLRGRKPPPPKKNSTQDVPEKPRDRRNQTVDLLPGERRC
ncbi:LOW QUALITY PROTEIN: TATA box-binding protein-associated factor RNA polymerase I subunit B [Myripristis murdjan]|uniref:LOW QUALITY PROTEIN: TATA box-binding protein-associated factor RNA polymerase I subunit B n=1 Tax=Myripristis murdjan TaxID=586833 RepID=UPI001175EE5D|nr:LOW QUALITY PROTEIN: TATA box-binding protein-associated factor RNA polymerase I subunit B [Myripristis murdjan]